MAITDFFRRRKRHFLIIGALAAVGYVGVNLVAYSLTYKPEACLACHLMKPYYENWKASTHARVSCVDCHPYRPSTIVMSSVRYLAGTYRLPLTSRVEDKECVLCHKPETVKVVNFRGTAFNHLEHIRKEKRGKHLHCTSCHSTLVQHRTGDPGTHMAVDQNVCTLCHFYTTPPGYNQNCTVCHGVKRKVVKIGEVDFAHESFLKTGARCIECHSQTVTGAGAVSPERCRECHVERTLDGRIAERVHAIHVSERYIDCFKCHGKIEHGKETTHFSRAIDLSCNECHTSTHGPTRDMYMGIGAQDLKDSPSAMYVSKVRCAGCHTLEKSVQGKEILSRSWEAKKKSCVLCHKAGYDRMAEDWKKNVSAFTDGLAAMMEQYGKTLKQRKARGDLAAAYRTMEHDLDFLKQGRGEHNIRYAFDIGRGIVAGVKRGYKQLGISDPKVKVPDQAAKPDGLCMFCHTTYVPEGDITIKGLNKKLNHPMHKEAVDDCTKCHDPKLHRMGSGFNKGACAACHPDFKL